MKANSPLLLVADFIYRKSYPSYRLLYFLYKSISDRKEKRWIKQFVLPGMIVADVGANVGDYTLFLSDLVGESGEVHSFEPDKENFQRLKKSVEDRNNVVVYNQAVSDFSGKVTFYRSKYLNVDNRIYEDEEMNAVSYEVDCLSLDSIFGVNQLDFIKMDIEGAEYMALQGAKHLMENGENLKMLIEIWPYGIKKSGSHVSYLLDLLEDNGFRLELVDKGFSFYSAREGKYDDEIGVYTNAIVLK